MELVEVKVEVRVVVEVKAVVKARVVVEVSLVNGPLDRSVSHQ